MQTHTASSTSASLIERVLERDDAAWQRLATIYTPLVYGWARKGGLQNSDAVDIVQEVFRSVLRGISGFQKGPSSGSFRAWLWTITRNQVRLFYRQRVDQTQAMGGSDALRHMQQLPAWFEPDTEPMATNNHREIVHRALELVRGDFQPLTWQAFAETTLRQRSAAEVAAELGMTDNAVRQAKFRVLRRLRQELEGLL